MKPELYVGSWVSGALTMMGLALLWSGGRNLVLGAVTLLFGIGMSVVFLYEGDIL